MSGWPRRILGPSEPASREPPNRNLGKPLLSLRLWGRGMVAPAIPRPRRNRHPTSSGPNTVPKLEVGVAQPRRGPFKFRVAVAGTRLAPDDVLAGSRFPPASFLAKSWSSLETPRREKKGKVGPRQSSGKEPQKKIQPLALLLSWSVFC